MSAQEEILVAVEQGIMTISLNRPEKKNALTDAMYGKINEALTEAAHNDEIQVVLFHGNSDCFTAGNDIGDFLKASSNLTETNVVKMLMILADFAKPVVAAVHGNAVGVGTTILLHCDIVVAAKNSIFAMPFVPLGLCPEAASSLLLPQLAGYHQAAELLLLGEAFDSDKAMSIGLINRLVDEKEVKLQGMAICQKLAGLPSESVLVTKKLMKSSSDNIKERMGQEFQTFGELLQGPAAKKAFQAFLSK